MCCNRAKQRRSACVRWPTARRLNWWRYGSRGTSLEARALRRPLCHRASHCPDTRPKTSSGGTRACVEQTRRVFAPQLLGEQCFDQLLQFPFLSVVLVFEFDAHTRWVRSGRSFWGCGSDDPAAQAERTLHRRHTEHEDEVRADRERLLRADEGSASGDAVDV